MLPATSKGALVGWTTADAHASPNDLLELTSPILEEARGNDLDPALDDGYWQRRLECDDGIARPAGRRISASAGGGCGIVTSAR